MPLRRTFRNSEQILAIVLLTVSSCTSVIDTKNESLLRAGGYYFENVDVVQITYISTQLFKVSHIEFEPRKQSVRISTILENGIKRREDIALAVQQVQFLQKLNVSDVLQAQYSKTPKNNYVYKGLYINGQALEDVYYQRVPARWRVITSY
ncbi:MAG: hypothetical protein HYV97_02595 [Bdellovibrio sp.]|nr:hypothetical protein [Bdellovibrio sp.]